MDTPLGLGLPSPLGLHEAAALIGAYRWTELQLFSLTGSWVHDCDDPETRVHLDLVSGEHGWHAEIWEERLPVVDGMDAQALTRPSGSALEPLFSSVPAAVAEVASSTGAAAGALRMAVLYRVLVPRLLATYEHHLRHSAPVSDGPTIRALRIVLRDELESWQIGEMLLERQLRSASDVAGLAALQARLESTLVEAGPGPGLVPWPGTGA